MGQASRNLEYFRHSKLAVISLKTIFDSGELFVISELLISRKLECAIP